MGMGGPMGQQPVLDPSTKRTPVTAGRAAGYLYEPIAPGNKSHIGIFVMHSGVDYTNFSACYELSKRGYTVLCTKNAGGGLNSTLLDAKSSVAYLRKVPGVQKIVIWGHSGGATLMTAYQMIAENGVKACQGPEKLAKCPNNLANMPAADGMILADSNWGNAEMSLFSLDPAVIAEGDGVNINTDLDLFNPKNGYDPKGSDYSQEFIRKFQTAVGKRENVLIANAQSSVAAIDAGKGHFADDEPLVIAGANSLGPMNKLFPQDVKLMAHTVKPWPLIHADGSITTEIVHSVRPPSAMKSSSAMFSNAVNTTVRTFLTDNAIRVSDDFSYDESSVHGVDWTSSYSSPPGNVESIRVPSLFMGMTGNYEYLAAETIYNNSPATDKSLAFVEGASHMYSTCKQCEKTPGQYGDTIKTLYDYADQWLSKPGRFLGE
jgi:pimeloyl-ACP methyl ester carboxylesterase